MGLSNFPSPAEGLLPLLVMNTVLSVALLKNMVRSLLHVVGAGGSSTSLSNLHQDSSNDASEDTVSRGRGRRRRISITRYESLCRSRFGIARTCSTSNGRNTTSSQDNMGAQLVECCCVCLCGFEADIEVSELSCKHFFHKDCLEKWFDNQQMDTCPLCRSML